MNVTRMNREGQIDLLKKIVDGLDQAIDDDCLDDDQLEDLLITLVNTLDEYDSDDTFGTEGWKHNFSVED